MLNKYYRGTNFRTWENFFPDSNSFDFGNDQHSLLAHLGCTSRNKLAHISRERVRWSFLSICKKGMLRKLKIVFLTINKKGCSKQPTENYLFNFKFAWPCFDIMCTFLSASWGEFFVSSCKIFWLQWKLIYLVLLKWIGKQNHVKILGIEKKLKWIRICLSFVSSIETGHRL